MPYAYAQDVTADGNTIVGVSRNANGFNRAFKWNAVDGMMPVGDLPGSLNSEATTISADGQVIGGGGDGGTPGWYWTAGEGFRFVGALRPAGLTLTKALSGDGTLIVGYGATSYAPMHIGVMWNGPGTITDIGHLPATTAYSRAFGVSDNGRLIVGESLSDASGSVAAIWTVQNGTAQIRDLKSLLQNEHGVDVTGWLLESATGVSADGRVIVGYGTNPLGDRVAWRVTLPVPEPTATLLFAICSPAFVRTNFARPVR
jgi:uncharacterized membrane protein